MSYDAIILGAGAAGCMAAIQAGKRGRKVLLVEQGRRVGGKIPISGGGRCNFTNRHATDADYEGANPRFARSALAGFPPADVEDWVARAGIPYHEKKAGQLFCDRSALEIVELLEADLKASGVAIALGRSVQRVERFGPDRFQVSGDGWMELGGRVVVALGGQSYPVLGANDLAFRIARSFGLSVEATAPALDGFLFAPRELERWKDLPGLAVEARLTVGRRTFPEPVLFTHRGLSGPAALRASLPWRPGEPVVLDFWPSDDLETVLLEAKKSHAGATLLSVLASRLPQRLAERWVSLLQPPSMDLTRLGDRFLRLCAEAVHNERFVPAGTVGWHKAEVTRGGVSTRQLDQRTLACRDVPGLHFVGECVDITGQLGGFNFQWAWASGAAAGRAV